MSELKFTGTATLTGFPREKSFSFELDGTDRMIIKAGKDVFVVIEKEPLVTLIADTTKALEVLIEKTAEPVAVQLPNNAVLAGNYTESTAAPQEESTGRKPRGPNVKIDESLLIYIDINKPNPYRGLRAKYYETLKTAIGRPVSWWKDTSMVKGLEGSPSTLLKFFLSENAVELRPAQNVQTPQGQPIVPSFGAAQPVAGPNWTPAGGPTPAPNGTPPASFM